MSEAISIPTVEAGRLQAGEKRTRLPSWLNARVLSCAWAALIIYMTLVPFHFEIEASINQADNIASWMVGVATSLEWFTFGPDDVSSRGNPNWLNDLIFNFVLFAPLGVLLRLDVTKQSEHWLGQMLRVTGSLLLLSWVIECAQGLIPERIGSINDIVSNTASGILTALFAVKISDLSKKTVFGAYCKLSYGLYHTKEFLIRQRRKPYLMFFVAGTNILFVAYWYAAASAAGSPGKTALINWLPFAVVVERSYDVAAIQIGRSLAAYCLFSMILSLQFMRANHRKGLGWIVLIVAALAVAREAIEFQAAGIRPDVTEPIIGIMAVGFIITTACLLAHAVRCSCRRKKQTPVQFERRKIPFQYEE